MTLIAPLCFSRTASSTRVSPEIEYMCNLPSCPPIMASLPSGETADAVTTNPRLMVDTIFVPRSMTTPESIETRASSGERSATLKSFGWFPISMASASPHWSPCKETRLICLSEEKERGAVRGRNPHRNSYFADALKFPTPKKTNLSYVSIMYYEWKTMSQ